jgi:hypothetical protein
MGERSVTHRFHRAGNISMHNASLSHPTICPLSENPMHSINISNEAQTSRQAQPA